MCRGQRSKAFGLATTQFPRSSQEINECICEGGFYILSCYQELCFRKGELGWLFLTRMKRQARLPKQKGWLFFHVTLTPNRYIRHVIVIDCLSPCILLYTMYTLYTYVYPCIPCIPCTPMYTLYTLYTPV